MLECESQDALRGLPGDQLDALHDPLDDNMLDARVLPLSVLTDQDGVDVVIGGLIPGNGAAGTNIGEEVEGAAEGQVEGDMALADGGLGVRVFSLLCAMKRQVVNKQLAVP